MRVLKYKQSAWFPLALLVLIAGLILMPLPVIAQEPNPDRPDPPPDRPEAPPDRPDPPTSGPGDTRREDGGQSERHTPVGSYSTVYGVVTNWGYRHEPKLPVTMEGGSWRIQKITDDKSNTL